MEKHLGVPGPGPWQLGPMPLYALEQSTLQEDYESLVTARQRENVRKRLNIKTLCELILALARLRSGGMQGNVDPRIAEWSRL